MAIAYFNNFPLRTYTMNPSPQPGEFEIVTDIFRRVQPLRRLLQAALVLYTYSIKEGDTPEMIAHKYYGSVNYHWIVTLFNDIIDPVVDWPKTSVGLREYIIDRYGSLQTSYTQIHHWTKTIVKDTSSVEEEGERYTSTTTHIIDQAMYNSLPASSVETFSFPDGRIVTKTTTKAIVSCYDYEEAANQAKRSILILNKSYLSQVTAELTSLLQ